MNNKSELAYSLKKPPISQFASDIVSFSSQYTTSNGAVHNLIGPPACFNKYGDNASAWCPARFNSHEFVEVRFEREVYLEKARFYENLNGGCVVRVDALLAGAGNKYVTVWQRKRAEVKRSYNVFEIDFQQDTIVKSSSTCRSRQLKIFLDCSSLKYYTQMDAVELIGLILYPYFLSCK